MSYSVFGVRHLADQSATVQLKRVFHNVVLIVKLNLNVYYGNTLRNYEFILGSFHYHFGDIELAPITSEDILAFMSEVSGAEAMRWIDNLQGYCYIAAQGRMLGIDTPFKAVVVQMTKEIEDGKRKIDRG
ncbi:MAG: hypothetical protein P8X90_17385 [Desulfobacterales bacterium]